MEDEKESGFKITDRRKFNPDGSLRDDGVEETPEATPEPKKNDSARGNVVTFPEATATREPAQQETPPEAKARNAAAEAYRETGTPEASFTSLINMLAVEAALSLGLIEHPTAGRQELDLETGRHLIDMLGVLQEKTRGNLTDPENEMLEGVLADLRMQFVALSRRQ